MFRLLQFLLERSCRFGSFGFLKSDVNRNVSTLNRFQFQQINFVHIVKRFKSYLTLIKNTSHLDIKHFLQDFEVLLHNNVVSWRFTILFLPQLRFFVWHNVYTMRCTVRRNTRMISIQKRKHHIYTCSICSVRQYLHKGTCAPLFQSFSMNLVRYILSLK